MAGGFQILKSPKIWIIGYHWIRLDRLSRYQPRNLTISPGRFTKSQRGLDHLRPWGLANGNFAACWLINPLENGTNLSTILIILLIHSWSFTIVDGCFTLFSSRSFGKLSWNLCWTCQNLYGFRKLPSSWRLSKKSWPIYLKALANSIWRTQGGIRFQGDAPITALPDHFVAVPKVLPESLEQV